MGRPLYSLDEKQTLRVRRRQKSDEALLLERESVNRWSRGDFDPDSDDFFTNAVEEFGLPGIAKEVTLRQATMIARAEATLGSESSHEPNDSDLSWANSPPWPLFETDSHIHSTLPSRSIVAENTPVTSEDPFITQVRNRFIQTDTLPSSQTSRTPEPWVAELAPTTPPSHLTGETPAVLPPSMFPTTPRQVLDLTPILWGDSSDMIGTHSNHVTSHREEFRRISQTA